jgi:hypothetical protein
MYVQIESIPTENSVKILKWMKAEILNTRSEEVFVYHHGETGILEKAITLTNGTDSEIFDTNDRLSLAPIPKGQFLLGAFTDDLKIEFWFYPFFAPGDPEYEAFIARMDAGF